MIPVNAIIIASHVPILATVVAAGVRYKTLSRPLRVFCWFLFLSGGIQFASLALCYSNRNNMPLLHLYVAAGFPCLALFYRSVFGPFINRWIVIVVIAAFLLFTAANSLFIQTIYRFNSNALALESVLIIILALAAFVFFLNSATYDLHLPDLKSLTWINSGLFLYYLSCLLIFYFGDTIIFRYARDLGRLTWMFHSAFSIIMYCCFFIGLVWTRKPTS